ncbi:hypothetical protein [Kineosporia sp. A_224]|uniref:hypothetical protein n=1 Tax=Kineosporia sp. A_224 TaxID=1962180 RepID=UPI000B4B024F|nr:hypothetical protein [Kineosporia sp. A_224]
MSRPRIWQETPGRLAARAILAGLAADETEPFDVRIAALDAVGELQDDLPPGCTLDSVDVLPGTVQHARQLLLEDVERQGSTRDTLATSRAAARLASF